jgi:hypothetical protein
MAMPWLVSKEMGFEDTYLVLLTPITLEIAPGNLVHSICNHPARSTLHTEGRPEGLAT